MEENNRFINSKLDLLIINPPFSRLKGVPYNVDFYLNSGYLASGLRNICDVKIYNADNPQDGEKEKLTQEDSKYLSKRYFNLFESSANYKNALKSDIHPVWDEVKRTFLKYQPKIIGVSCMSALYPSALRVAQIYKSCFPEGIVIFGGQHPTIRAE